MAGAETERLPCAWYSLRSVLPMDRQLWEWKLALERIWSARAPDYHAAACLVAAIVGASEEAILRQAATQALPILRSASAEESHQSTRDAARRRLGVIRDVLHELPTPRFGQRQTLSKSLSPEVRYRQLLGLPLRRRLSRVDIHRPYKPVANRAHPDPAGTQRPFLE